MIREGDDVLVFLSVQPRFQILFPQDLTSHESVGFADTQGRAHPSQTPSIETVSRL